MLPGSPNAQPLFRATSPSGYAAALAGTAVDYDSDVVDLDGSVASVAFRVNGVALATDFTWPFAFSWAPPAIGSYSIDATATDNAGASAVSPVTTFRSYAFSELNSFAKFREIHFGQNQNLLTIAGAGVDPFGTGIQNLLAFLLGLDPRKPDLTRLPTLTFEGSDIVYRFFYLSQSSGVLFQPLASSSLLSLAPVPGNQITNLDADGRYRRVEVRVPRAGQTRHFFQLSLQELP